MVQEPSRNPAPRTPRMESVTRSPDDIDDLARRAQDGDDAALADLLTLLRPRVLAVCRGVLPHLADAEDACQEALIKIHGRIGSWNGRGRFTTWMHVVALNAARSTYRKLRTQARPTDEIHLERPDPRTTSVIAGTRLDLLEALEEIEPGHPQYIEPLVLRDVYGLSYEEIATQLGAPLGTVKAQVHHGRRLVRPLLLARD